MKSVIEYLKTEFLGLEPREMLRQEVTVLLGVSEEAKEVLNDLKISTVFDLASSRIFNNALHVLNSSNANSTTFSRLGSIPTDVIDNRYRNADLTDLFKQDVRLLDGIGSRNANKVKNDLEVETIRDLALWPPFTAASQILRKVIIPEELDGYDPEAPPDLIPSSGNYPTEKAFYSVMVLDEIERDDDQELQEIEAPIDVTDIRQVGDGFNKPAFGAIITYEQAWFAQGVALGNLLHSVALAPGESTRIAMINWSRLDRSSLTEEISQSEQLSNVTNQARSISEVTSAVATEAQDGFSQATNRNYANSTSGQRSKAETGGFSLGIGGYSNTTTNSRTSNRAVSSSFTSSVSSSSGRRDLAAQMAQNINNSTQQFATSVRSQRASVIAETLQSEDETITTRVITNYNHMHALSIQYYEVVQAFRAITSVSNIEKLVFIPMKIIRKWDSTLIPLFRNILIDFALSEEFLIALLGRPGRIWIRPAVQIDSVAELDPAVVTQNTLRNANLLLGYTVAEEIISSYFVNRNDERIVGFRYDGLLPPGTVVGNEKLLKSVIFSFDDGSQRQWDFDPTSGEGAGYFILFDDTKLRGGFENLGTLDLSRITQVTAIYSELPESMSYLNFTFMGPQITGDDYPSSYFLRIFTRVTPQNTTALQDGKISVRLLDVFEVWGENDFHEHLNQNALYYSQAIWSNMNDSQRALLLSKYEINGKPLLGQIDGTPLGVYANYLIFRMNVDQENANQVTEWEKWKEDHGFMEDNITQQEIVPLPSGGVFAEAVLGRFNSAEKLDMTRFWNWQDSPIPFKAPEIASINAGSRFQNVQVEPSELAQPMINIVNPQSLPDPTGMSSILNALTASNMFRDMSGLAQTAALAQSGLQAAFNAATAAGDQAQANLASTTMANLQAYQATMQAANDRLKMAMSAATGMPVPPGGSNISNAGSVVNQAQKIDRRNAETPVSIGATNNSGSNGSNSSGGGSNPGGINPSGGGSAGNSIGSSSSGGGSLEVDALKHVYNSAAGANSVLASSGASGDLANALVSSTPDGSPSQTSATSVSIQTPNDTRAILNQNITLEGTGNPNPGVLSWEGGEDPISGTGNNFTTRFTTIGNKTINALWTTESGQTATASINVIVSELSGNQWVPRFPQRNDIAALQEPFRTSVQRFVDALRAGSATVTIDSTLRPIERAYLMHYSWRVTRPQGNRYRIAPNNIPFRDGVFIEWVHRDADNNPNHPQSIQAAQDMVNGYGIAPNLQVPPALNSRHLQGRAIDMEVTWNGVIEVRDGGGNNVQLDSSATPNPNLNPVLRQIGESYGVHKLNNPAADPPHWSDDGR